MARPVLRNGVVTMAMPGTPCSSIRIVSSTLLELHDPQSPMPEITRSAWARRALMPASSISWHGDLHAVARGQPFRQLAQQSVGVELRVVHEPEAQPSEARRAGSEQYLALHRLRGRVEELHEVLPGMSM